MTGVNTDEGRITGHYYDPAQGGVVGRADTLSPDASAAYLAGEGQASADTAPAVAATPGAALDAAADESTAKDKGNNGVGWGTGGNPGTKTTGDGTQKKNGQK